MENHVSKSHEFCFLHDKIEPGDAFDYKSHKVIPRPDAIYPSLTKNADHFHIRRNTFEFIHMLETYPLCTICLYNQKQTMVNLLKFYNRVAMYNSLVYEIRKDNVCSNYLVRSIDYTPEIRKYVSSVIYGTRFWITSNEGISEQDIRSIIYRKEDVDNDLEKKKILIFTGEEPQEMTIEDTKHVVSLRGSKNISLIQYELRPYLKRKDIELFDHKKSDQLVTFLAVFVHNLGLLLEKNEKSEAIPEISDDYEDLYFGTVETSKQIQEFIERNDTKNDIKKIKSAHFTFSLFYKQILQLTKLSVQISVDDFLPKNSDKIIEFLKGKLIEMKEEPLNKGTDEKTRGVNEDHDSNNSQEANQRIA
ncbi:hypothetical protein FO519_005068 [Halicephalobus sp. NKZ332]|nr:hypothetical protein FO519_005068 [Halicephalobus sp. NKZ332]